MEEKIIIKGKNIAFKKAIVTSLILGIILILISALIFSGILIYDYMYLYEHVHGDNHYPNCYDSNGILICEHDNFDTAFGYAISRFFSDGLAKIGSWSSELILVAGVCVLLCVIMAIIIYNRLKRNKISVSGNSVFGVSSSKKTFDLSFDEVKFVSVKGHKFFIVASEGKPIKIKCIKNTKEVYDIINQNIKDQKMSQSSIGNETITFKPNGRKEWAITDSEIIIGKKILPLSSLCGIEHRPPEKASSQGIIFVYQKGRNSEQYNVDDFTTLVYNNKDSEDAKKVLERLVSLFDSENYDIDLDQNTGKCYIKEKRNQVKPQQFYKKCNTCGHVYCYTQGDLNRNKQLSRQAAANSFASAFGPMMMSATYVQSANDSKSRIVDYDKCPKCNSVDVVSITEEEAENISKNQNTQQSSISQADELKKFKELLDSGVITQEEFDAKKKEILGL